MEDSFFWVADAEDSPDAALPLIAAAEKNAQLRHKFLMYVHPGRLRPVYPAASYAHKYTMASIATFVRYNCE